MKFDWFDARLAATFGKELAQEVNRIFPLAPGVERPVWTKKEVQREMRKLDSLFLRVQTFSRQNRLNVYKKAKLLNALKWNLREYGQDEKLINETVILIASMLK